MAQRNENPSKKKFYTVAKIPNNKKIINPIKPMLAMETEAPFDSKDWLFEIKWDGYRAISEIKDGEVKLYSRNGNSFLNSYPAVTEALKKIKHNVILDGEIVILNSDGKSDFQKLQHYEDNQTAPIAYYVFDILQVAEQKTTELPLTDRKALLKKIIPRNSIVKYSDHVHEKGISFFKSAQDNNLEGIMAKKADSEYHTGSRTGDWLKIKHHKSEEVIVVGFTEPTGHRQYFGALVLAVKAKDGLHYAGHTGTGFDDKTLAAVHEKLQKIITKNSPFKEKVKTNMPVTWVKPVYIAEIKFTEWTTDGKMRHPVFLQMRADKKIKDLVMPTVKKNNPALLKKEAKENDNSGLKIGKVTVKITHRDKVIFRMI